MIFQKAFKNGDKVIELKRGMAVSDITYKEGSDQPYCLQTPNATYTETGHLHECNQHNGSAPDLIDATPDNVNMLKKLFPETEIKLPSVGEGDLGEKLGQKIANGDFAFMAFVSDESNERAIEHGQDALALIVGYEESHDYKFRALDHATWKFAVPVNNDMTIMTEGKPSADEPSADEPSELSVGDKVRLVSCSGGSRFKVGHEFTVIGFDERDETYVVDAGFWLMKVADHYSLFLFPSEVFEKV